MILTVTLNPTVDIVCPVKSFIRNSVFRTPIIYSYPGGKGTNVARALSILGEKVIATGFCGEKNFKAMDELLKKFKIKNEFISIKGENRPCILITEIKEKKETIINSESTFTITETDKKKFLNKIENLAKKCKYTVISGSLPRSLPKNFYAEVINKIKNFSSVLLDTSSAYLKNAIKSSPHIIKLNIEELKKTFNINFKTKTQLKNFISAISKKYNIKIIIITLNEKGAVLYDNKNFYFFKSIKTKELISPVGSGDAFSAGFIYGISKGMDLIFSTKLAIACATANLMHTGSCFINKNDVFRLVKKVYFTQKL